MKEFKKALKKIHDASASDTTESDLGLENVIGRDAEGIQIWGGGVLRRTWRAQRVFPDGETWPASPLSSLGWHRVRVKGIQESISSLHAILRRM